MRESARLRASEIADLVETMSMLDVAKVRGMAAIEGRVRDLDPDIASIDGSIRLMQARQSVLGDAYPFGVTGGSVTRRIDLGQANPYVAMLAMSPGTVMREYMSPSDITTCAVSFEQLCEIAIRSLLGPDSQAVRFAWPSDSGRPPEFPKAIEWLAKRMGLALGGGYLPPRRKDGGVDIVAWRSFGDKRTAFPVLLAQCTVQRDLLSKSADIDAANWSRWLKLLREPATAIMSPSVVDGSGEHWIELAQRNIVLDRLRIAKLCHAQREEMPSGIQARVEGWLKSAEAALYRG